MKPPGYDVEAGKIADQLQEPATEARNLARKLGLDPYPVKYWVVDYEEMNQLIAYDGFQERYPHWRWGMKYDRQQKQYQYGGGKAFEIVINDDPSHAFLQESNDIADQKAVITHVEAHADFFANNKWYGMFADDLDAAAMLARHGRTIASFMSDPEIDREAVESWIDNLLCLEDNIDQHQSFKDLDRSGASETEAEDLAEKLGEMNVSEEVRAEVFDEEWLESVQDDSASATVPEEPEKDLLWFLREYGKAYDEDAEKAVELEEWQQTLIDLLREEAYYFAAQKMSKVMNEGWAAYWESMMMGEEGFAGTDEFLDYADHQAKVLGSPGLNPYKLGKSMWEYVENFENRREVARKLLRVEGITWRNFQDVVDFGDVIEQLEPAPELASITPETLEDLPELDDALLDHENLDRALTGEIDVGSYPWKVLSYEGLAERHFSLTKPQNRGFLARITQEELEQLTRYLIDDARYDTVEEALADVEYTAGWDAMREIRASHNDVTFLDGYLTQEFVNENDFFTYEYTQTTGDYRVTSTDYRDVKKKLLLQFTNFGKPTIEVRDANYNNRNELLLAHQYNGVTLDVEQAKQTLARIHEVWGRPVNLKTIVKEYDEKDVKRARRRDGEPEPTEQGKLIRYDGRGFEIEDLSEEAVEDIAAAEVDYDTKPDEWLA
jgi:stage V sporulation protein R